MFTDFTGVLKILTQNTFQCTSHNFDPCVPPETSSEQNLNAEGSIYSYTTHEHMHIAYTCHKSTIQGKHFYFFGSRQLIVTKVDGRAGAKKTKAYNSGMLLRSADAPYKLCVTSEMQIFRHQCNTNTQGTNTTVM